MGQSRTVSITLGVGWDGRRDVLSVELANPESPISWKDHLFALKRVALSCMPTPQPA